MKKNIIILLSIIVAAILFRYGYTLFGQIMTGKAMKNKPAPQVVVETVEDENDRQLPRSV